MNQEVITFGKKFAELCEAFGEANSETKLTLYWSRLQGFEIGRIVRAIDYIIDHSRFFPKVAEIRELIEGSEDDRASQAWQLLIRAIEKGGPYASLHVDDPALADALLKTFGGWIEACNRLPIPGDPMHANLQKQFSGYYRQAIRNGSNSPRYFAGIHEATNRQSIGSWDRSIGGYSQPVTLIAGDQVFKRDLEFDGHTGALTESSRKAIESGLKPLPPAPAPKSLPAPTEAQEMASPEEMAQVRAAIKRLAGRSM